MVAEYATRSVVFGSGFGCCVLELESWEEVVAPGSESAVGNGDDDGDVVVLGESESERRTSAESSLSTERARKAISARRESGKGISIVLRRGSESAVLLSYLRFHFW